MDNKSNAVNQLDNTVTKSNQTYVDQFGNPIDPSLIDENGNYIGNPVNYVDQFGNPIDPSLIDENGNYIGNNIEAENSNNNPIDLDQSALTSTLDSIQKAYNSIDPIQEENNKFGRESVFENTNDIHLIKYDYNNVPITDIVNQIILDSIKRKASDIHFDPYADGIKVRVRIDGVLKDYSVVPLFVKKNMITRIKIISGLNITESRIPQDGAIRTMLNGRSIDLRVSCLPTNLGEKIVLRIMDYSMSNEGIETLDFSPENMTKVNKMLSIPNGIILVTGATGSGKSTTVYSMLQRLNREEANIITVEDPIEMSIPGINQVQAQPEIGLDFATVLRSILRQDPDIIMIGEIRDDETARIAVRASITGHLVLSTIHTNNSLATIERLTDMSVERYLLGTSLSGIISQKLARRLCDNCKKSVRASKYERIIFKTALGEDIDRIYKPVGCPECEGGYKGRIAIQEVLYLTQEIKDAITSGVEKEALRDIVYGDGSATKSLLQDGLLKVIDGKTSFEEILKLIDVDDNLGLDALQTSNEIGEDAELGTTISDNDLDEAEIGDILYNDRDDELPDFELTKLSTISESDVETNLIFKITELNEMINNLEPIEIDTNDFIFEDDEILKENEEAEKISEKLRLEKEREEYIKAFAESKKKEEKEKEHYKRVHIDPEYLPEMVKNFDYEKEFNNDLIDFEEINIEQEENEDFDIKFVDEDKDTDNKLKKMIDDLDEIEIEPVDDFVILPPGNINKQENINKILKDIEDLKDNDLSDEDIIDSYIIDNKFDLDEH